MLIDTGSVVSLFPARHNFPQSLLTPANIAISDVQGKPIHTTGQFTVDISIRPLRRKFSCNFLVANVEQAILGSDFLAKHDLSVNVRQQTLFDNSTGLNSIVKNCSNVHCEIIAKVTENFPFGEKFQELTSAPNFTEVTHKTEHFIDTGDQRPIAYKARKLSPSKLECAKKEFDMLLQMGIIRRSDSPWASPLHLVKKVTVNGDPVETTVHLTKLPLTISTLCLTFRCSQINWKVVLFSAKLISSRPITKFLWLPRIFRKLLS